MRMPLKWKQLRDQTRSVPMLSRLQALFSWDGQRATAEAKPTFDNPDLPVSDHWQVIPHAKVNQKTA